MATFVDNLFTTGCTLENATAILEDCEAYLKQRWYLEYGADSREVMTCNGYQHPISIHERCIQKGTIRCFGHFLDNDGGIRTCFDNSAKAMWRAFFGKLSQGLLVSSEAAKTRFLGTSISSIPSFRWSRWPYQCKYAQKLERIQRQMIAILMHIKPAPGESCDTFSRRRRTQTSRIANKAGVWSKRWARSVCSWKDHVSREHDCDTWSARILEFHDRAWLDDIRKLASCVNESRTNTRSTMRKVQRRWEEGLVVAISV